MKRANETDVMKNKKLKPSDTGQEMNKGIILSVSLQNFMCHDNLQFDFDPRVNFIIGQNGSGKSAILTGIILALGGKAKDTERYPSIKGFVKTNKNKARVSVTLKNSGSYPYKPDVFGEKITVEREITSEGNSSYKLKSSDGRIISTSKEELTNVLTAMDIQIDNPVVVLTQERSRHFLLSKQAEKLYDFFYRGANLQRLEKEYNESVDMNEKAQEDLVTKKKALNVVEKEVSQLQKLIESDKKLDELKREKFWAGVICMEKELNSKIVNRNKLLKSIQTTTQEIKKHETLYNTTCDELEKYKKESTEVDSKRVLEKKALQDLCFQLETCVDTVSRTKGQVKLFEREEEKLVEDIRELKKSIRDYEMKDQAEYENEKEQNAEKISQCLAAIQSSKERKNKWIECQQNLQTEQNSCYQDINHLTIEINELKYKKKIRQQDCNNIKHASQNKQLLFGLHTPQILADIHNSREDFLKVPKGPIGLDIKVKDKKWSSAVEACLKPNMLRSFCCDNARDSTVLTQILKKYYSDKMPSIIISPFLSKVHDVSQHKAQTSFPTVLDMLQIKDPVVANCLIDQLSIENIILIEDISTAQNIMLDNPPKNCYSAFLENCDEILLNPYRYYSASMKVTNMLSQTFDKKYLQEIEQEILKLDDEVSKKETEKTNLRIKLQNFPQQAKELDKKIIALETVISTNQRAIEHLNEYKPMPNVPEMHEECESLRADLSKKQEKLMESQKILATHEKKHKELREKVDSYKKLVQTLKTEYGILRGKMEDSARNIEILSSTKRSFETNLKSDEKDLQLLEKDIQNKEASIKSCIEKRKKTDSLPRMNTNRSLEEIDIQLQEMKKVICEKSNTTDKKSLNKKYMDKKEKLLRDKNDYKQIEKINEKMSKMLKKRKSGLNTMIQHAERMLDSHFVHNLSYNEYSGQIKFQGKSLKLEVSPKPEHSATGVRSCSLSGGERSFVTISFVLALWERISVPFRILDEYDVFMDSNNRYMSINILLMKTETMSNVQFIFLSPLDLPEMVSTENVKIHKMPAPQRIGLTNMEEE